MTEDDMFPPLDFDPEMAEALEAAEELARTLTWYCKTPHADLYPVMSALARYRKATGETT